jgi:hypothetical protein
LNVISWIDVSTRDDAINLRNDVTVTKVQFSLSEFVVGGFEFSLGLLDGRSLRRELGESAVDIALFFELVEHLLWGLAIRMDNTELSRTLNKVSLCLEDRRKRLIEIGRLRSSPRSGCGGNPKEARTRWTAASAWVTCAPAVDKASCRRSYS